MKKKPYKYEIEGFKRILEFWDEEGYYDLSGECPQYISDIKQWDCKNCLRHFPRGNEICAVPCPCCNYSKSYLRKRLKELTR